MTRELEKMVLFTFAGILFFHGFCYTEKGPNYTFLHQATSAPLISYYDYIIVGGGTAGCPLAATLSLNFSVLLLERGGSPYGNPNISNPASFAETLSDTSPSSPSQRFISDDGVVNARARVLGGGSCINAGFYSRAGPEYVSEAGWDGNLVNKSYEWVEKIVAFEPSVRQWQTAFRDGLLEAGVHPDNGYTFDHVYGTKVGGTIFDQDDKRHTAADLLQYANPDGIVVLLHATVHRILFETKGERKPVANGVIFSDANGIKHTAYLTKNPKNEIILSSGSIGSTQLLMLSGIGPSEHLKTLGIDVVFDNPEVGQGMSDNPMNAIFIPSPSPVEISLVQIVGITRVGSYVEGASGALFVVSPDSSGNFGMTQSQVDRRSSETLAKSKNSDFRGGFIIEKVTGPLSSGHLLLKNRDPSDNPYVKFNYFQEPEDLKRCVEGIRTIEKVIESKAFSNFIFPDLSFQALLNLTANFPVNLRPKSDKTTASLEQFCRDTVTTIWHYHGGCLVKKVIDQDYRVLGVDSLRVVDGSTFKFSPGTNPQATVMMLGRYVGVKIQNQRLGIEPKT